MNSSSSTRCLRIIARKRTKNVVNHDLTTPPQQQRLYSRTITSCATKSLDPRSTQVTNVTCQSQYQQQWFSSTRSYNDDHDNEENQRRKRVLVVGSSGALGSVVSNYLSQNCNCTVIGIDIIGGSNNNNSEPKKNNVDQFIPLDSVRTTNLQYLTEDMIRGLIQTIPHTINEEIENDMGLLDAIICTNGGWMGDPKPPLMDDDGDNDETEEGAIKNLLDGAKLYTTTIEQMMYKNLYPVIAAGYVSQQYMNRNGLMVVIGATAALGPTPGMIGYGISKSAVHHIVTTIGAMTGNSIVSKATRKIGRQQRRLLPTYDDLTVVGILPTTIDSVANRKVMKYDPTSWTPPMTIATEIGTWITSPALRPHSGSLIKVTTKKVAPLVQPKTTTTTAESSSSSSTPTAQTSFELVR